MYEVWVTGAGRWQNSQEYSVPFEHLFGAEHTQFMFLFFQMNDVCMFNFVTFVLFKMATADVHLIDNVKNR